MIRTIRIQGFKSLRDVKVELGRFNVLVGANGSGKTNLLEAIGLLGCAASGMVNDAAFLRRGVRPGLPSLYKTALESRRIRAQISLDATGANKARYRVSLNNPVSSPETDWKITHEEIADENRILASKGPRGARWQIEPMAPIPAERLAALAPLVRATVPEGAHADLLDDLDNFGIYSPNTPALRGTEVDSSGRKPIGLEGSLLASAVRALIREGADFSTFYRLVGWAKGIRVGRGDQAQLSAAVPQLRDVIALRDRYMVEKRSWLSAFDASEGALYVLFLITLALHPQVPRVLAVDNVDQALNPRLARELVGQVQDLVLADHSRPQMLLTAHNPLVLDSLRLLDDEVRLFVVGRLTNGETTVRRVPWNEAIDQKAKADGLTLSQLWTEGFLGGMPNI